MGEAHEAHEAHEAYEAHEADGTVWFRVADLAFPTTPTRPPWCRPRPASGRERAAWPWGAGAPSRGGALRLLRLG
ncbi:hypothetical protein GCM10009737_30410 [Nocardioides lentus]|uniref:Uncharacterized protein n=1 Tax=Nocardioides lentus TaxID=338077 RepID=A0ABN2PPU8_9ACTN